MPSGPGQPGPTEATRMARDLSLDHRPIGNLFPPMTAAEAQNRFALGATDIADYREYGYVAGGRVLDHGQIAALQAEIERIADPDHDGRELWYEYRANASYEKDRRLLHAVGGWRVSPVLHDLLWHPAIAMPLAQLVGGPIRLLHDQVFYKPAGSGGRVSWHQDYSYWTFTQPMAHASCWVALDDTTLENGCLHYVPASHLWGLLPITGLTGEGAGIESALDETRRRDFRPVPVEVKAGHAVFHHPLMIHGSGPNTSARPRRGIVVNVMADGTRAAEDLPDVDGVPAWLLGRTEDELAWPVGGAPKGGRLAGRFWPRLDGLSLPGRHAVGTR